MHHAVNIIIKTDKQAELGDVLNLAQLSCRPEISMRNLPMDFPCIVQAKRNTTFSASTSSTMTSTWLVETILPGCTFFFTQLISET